MLEEGPLDVSQMMKFYPACELVLVSNNRPGLKRLDVHTNTPLHRAAMFGTVCSRTSSDFFYFQRITLGTRRRLLYRLL